MLGKCVEEVFIIGVIDGRRESSEKVVIVLVNYLLLFGFEFWKKGVGRKGCGMWS